MTTETPTIKILDNSGVKLMFDFDTRNSNSTVDYYTLVKNIRNIFQQEFEKIAAFFSHQFPELIYISLEQEKISSESKTLACFDAEMSSSTELRFRIYYSSFLELHNYFSSGLNNSIQNFKQTVIHELIHAADLSVLKKINKQQTESYRMDKHDFSSFSRLGENNGFNYNIQWAFLGFIATFRNEGVAILGQKLFSETFSPSLSKYGAYEHFKNDFKSVLQLCKGINIYNRLSNSSVFEVLDKIRLNAYFYAEVMILEVLKEKLLLDKEKISLLYNYLKNPSNSTSVDESIKSDVILACFDLDISEYINGLLLLKSPDGNKYLLEHNEFYDYCGFLQEDINEENIKSFSKSIFRAAFLNDKAQFIDTVKSVVGSPLTSDEIKSSYSKFEQKTATEDILAEIKYYGNILLGSLDGENSEIAQWALTYLLDEKDLINDNISILGKQDDWIVLDAAVKIIQNIKK